MPGQKAKGSKAGRWDKKPANKCYKEEKRRVLNKLARMRRNGARKSALLAYADARTNGTPSKKLLDIVQLGKPDDEPKSTKRKLTLTRKLKARAEQRAGKPRPRN